jgi:Sec-independent protein secretion pathway component TatC
MTLRRPGTMDGDGGVLGVTKGPEQVEELRMAEEQRTLTIIEHLTELRKRITIALAALVVGVVVAFIFQGYIFKILMRPLHGTKVQSITTFGPA